MSRKDAANTKNLPTWQSNVSDIFLKESGRNSLDFETYTPVELDNKQFYVGARKTDGTLRYLHFRTLGIEKTNMDSTKDSAFTNSNQVFQAVATDLKRKGLIKVDNRPPISEQDLKKIHTDETHVFDVNTPYGLQRKGNMTIDTFQLGTDDTGRRFIYQAVDELDKNHRADYSTESVTEGRMFEVQGKAITQPPLLYSLNVLYTRVFTPTLDWTANEHALLNVDIHQSKRKDLWQRPKDSFLASDSTWYYDAVLGKNTLSELMSKISETGKLSRVYKNHSVRATSITVLVTVGISGIHISRISDHKSESSLKSYSHHVSDSKKREISDTLTNALCSAPKKNCEVESNGNSGSLCDINDIFYSGFELENVDQAVYDAELSPDPNLSTVATNFVNTIKSFQISEPRHNVDIHQSKRKDLWQRPKDSFLASDSTWYYDAVLGKNTLSELMSKISETGKLSRVYKNHSVRATSITVLVTVGISGIHISRISDHKSESSLKSYSHHVSDSKKREISDTLTNALCSAPKKNCEVESNGNSGSLCDINDIFYSGFELENVDQAVYDAELSPDPNLSTVATNFVNTIKSFQISEPRHNVDIHQSKRKDLWQRPKDSFLASDSTWYYDAVLGKNTLSELMSKISETGKLSRVYKNHSVRATSITVLVTVGISGIHISRISDHKSESSLKSYSHHVSDSKKREISDTLTNALCSAPKKNCEVESNGNSGSLCDINDIFYSGFELENVDQAVYDAELSPDPNLSTVATNFVNTIKSFQISEPRQ
ncbi:LOW QUALITY PROTEIN: hypothetical protein KUTeg_002120 [Tegillarca granosa]|uniref:Tyr recombinase domain-containing protein n=1 Tax=Tegillarca granosa TaxID=220873 RepID=A0ABQ9FXV7_TEGGR|nr:LOW QUALITY PROTEIN: hypothetical protein KUTeg_002120 [Tegillarca granosa]